MAQRTSTGFLTPLLAVGVFGALVLTQVTPAPQRSEPMSQAWSIAFKWVVWPEGPQ